MNIHLFRHGEVDGPAALYGKTDIALSAAGLDALRRATEALDPPEAIVSSPLRRCRSFAQAQARSFNCPLQLDADLREMDFGLWDGVPYSEHSPAWPAMRAFWHRPAEITPPEGESLEAVERRVRGAWRRVLELPQQNIWCFAHGGVIRLILAHLLEINWRNPQLYSTLQIAYASRTLIQIETHDEHKIKRVRAIAIPAPLAHSTGACLGNSDQFKLAPSTR